MLLLIHSSLCVNVACECLWSNLPVMIPWSCLATRFSLWTGIPRMTAGAWFGFEGFRRVAVDHYGRCCMHRFPTVHCSQRRSPRSPGPADQADRTAGQVAPTILMRSAFELCTCLDRGNVACFWISTGSARSSSLTPRSPPAYEVPRKNVSCKVAVDIS